MNIAQEIALRLNNIKHTFHALEEEAADGITAEQLENALKSGFEVIEQYPDDPRGLSCIYTAQIKMDRKLQREDKMKTCYMCKGAVELSLVNVELKGVVVKDIPAEVCKRCGEKYFDTRTASFIQEITGCIDEKRKGLIENIIRSNVDIKGAAEA